MHCVLLWNNSSLWTVLSFIVFSSQRRRKLLENDVEKYLLREYLHRALCPLKVCHLCDMDGGPSWDGMSWCTKYLTLKRGVLLAFCYTFLCLLYLSIAYREPYTSSNYGAQKTLSNKAEKEAEIIRVGERDVDPKVTLTTASTVEDPLDAIRLVEELKPNSTGMPWINYKNVLTNESVALHCGTCAVVSSSGQLLGRRAGAHIDANDCVIRMNDAPVRGYEHDVGSRTTMRLVGHSNIRKTFGVDLDLQKELFEDPASITERVVVHFFQNTEIDNLVEEFGTIRELAIKYPKTQFDFFTSEKMKFSEELFLRETGITRAQARTWFSTGWFTMLYAIDTCESINLYGMVYENYCSEHPDERTPYHYYDPASRTECGYYRVSEVRLSGGHLFITEKAIFARWSWLYRMYFHYPDWTNSTKRDSIQSLKTPFLRRYKLAGHHLFSRHPWWKLYFHFAGLFYPVVH